MASKGTAPSLHPCNPATRRQTAVVPETNKRLNVRHAYQHRTIRTYDMILGAYIRVRTYVERSLSDQFTRTGPPSHQVLPVLALLYTAVKTRY